MLVHIGHCRRSSSSYHTQLCLSQPLLLEMANSDSEEAETATGAAGSTRPRFAGSVTDLADALDMEHPGWLKWRESKDSSAAVDEQKALHAKPLVLRLAKLQPNLCFSRKM
eukprot:15288696-Alexandrium_andersonii.AAC.1